MCPVAFSDQGVKYLDLALRYGSGTETGGERKHITNSWSRDAELVLKANEQVLPIQMLPHQDLVR
jgi:hypothetical protein